MTLPSRSVVSWLAVSLALALGGCSFVQSFEDFQVLPIDAAIEDGGVVSDASGDATVDAAADAGLLTPKSFVEQFVQLTCAKVLRCEHKLGLGVLAESLCHPDLAAQVLDELQLWGAADTDYDREAAEACLEGFDSVDCSVRNAGIDDVCLQVFKPTLDPGAACRFDSECIASRCELTPNTCGGTCTLLSTENEPCRGNADCLAPLVCAGTTCQPPAGQGESCINHPCATLYWCNPQFKCEPLPNVGDACRLDLGGDPCQGSLVCTVDDAPKRVCLVGGSEREPCSFELPCKPSHRCSGTGSCIPLAQPGGPCQSQENCPYFHGCVSEMCEPLPVVGQSCDPRRPCLTGFCQSGTCRWRTPGDPCLINGECQHGCGQPLGAKQCASPRAAGQPCVSSEQCIEGTECVGPDLSKTCQTCN